MLDYYVLPHCAKLKNFAWPWCDLNPQLMSYYFYFFRWVNPSDCVDMDCDGRRQLLVTDIDGTFSGGKAGDTIISKAEYEWDGNPSFGLGMFYFAT